MRHAWLVIIISSGWGCGDTIMQAPAAAGPTPVSLVGSWMYIGKENNIDQRFEFVFTDSTYVFRIWVMEATPPLAANALRWFESGLYAVRGCDWTQHCHGSGRVLEGRAYSFRAREWQKAEPEPPLYWILDYEPIVGGMDINGRTFQRLVEAEAQATP